MARISDVVRLGRRPRAPRPVDDETANLAAKRRVTPAVILPAHYRVDAPEFGAGDLSPGIVADAHVEGSAANGAPLLASVVPAEHYVRQTRSAWRMSKRVNEIEPWAADVFKFMRTGPGFVGTAAGMYGEWMAGSGRLIVQQRAGRTTQGQERWEETDYEPAREVLRMWRGDEATQQDLIREVLTFHDSVGQVYQCLRKADDGRWVIDLWAHTAISFNPERNRVIARGLENATEDDTLWYREYLPPLVDHLFLADREWRGKPTSQMQRVMQDIYRLILAERAVDRDLLSRLASNGVLHIPASPGSTKDWTSDYADWAGRAFSGTFDDGYIPGRSGGLEEVAPFLMQSIGKPEFVEIGRDLSRAMEAWKLAWNSICLGLDMPKAAMDGNEGASRWTGFLNRDEESLKAAAPRMQRLAALVERSHFRPWFNILGVGAGDREVNDFRVWYELPDVRPERTPEKIQVSGELVPKREALAEVVGWSPSDLAPLPAGMSEWEASFLLKHGQTVDTVIAAQDTAVAAAAEAQLAAEAAARAAQTSAEEDAASEELKAMGYLDDDGLPTESAFADGIYDRADYPELEPPPEPVPAPRQPRSARRAPGVRDPLEPVMPDGSGESSTDMPTIAAFRAELASWDDMVPR